MQNDLTPVNNVENLDGIKKYIQDKKYQTSLMSQISKWPRSYFMYNFFKFICYWCSIYAIWTLWLVSVQFLHETPHLFLAMAEIKPTAGLLSLSIYMTVVDF